MRKINVLISLSVVFLLLFAVGSMARGESYDRAWDSYEVDYEQERYEDIYYQEDFDRYWNEPNTYEEEYEFDGRVNAVKVNFPKYMEDVAEYVDKPEVYTSSGIVVPYVDVWHNWDMDSKVDYGIFNSKGDSYDSTETGGDHPNEVGAVDYYISGSGKNAFKLVDRCVSSSFVQKWDSLDTIPWSMLTENNFVDTGNYLLEFHAMNQQSTVYPLPVGTLKECSCVTEENYYLSWEHMWHWYEDGYDTSKDLGMYSTGLYPISAYAGSRCK